MMTRKRIGVIGFGNLGQYLVNEIVAHDDLELVFVWNRSPDAMTGKVQSDCVLPELSDFSLRKVDLIVEVAHPHITSEFGVAFLQHADYMIGSPTALADTALELRLRNAANKHGLYVPCGALWGAEDIRKMADRKTLRGLKITMTKHPRSFKLNGELKIKCDTVANDKTVLYDGWLYMSTPSISRLSLVYLLDRHIVEIEVMGVKQETSGQEFYCKTVRSNPSQIGHVTGSATYASFLGSLLRAGGRGCGIHIC